MIYLDASAIVKLARTEPDSEALREYLTELGDPPQVTSALSEVEVPRAMARYEPLAIMAAYRALDQMQKVRMDPSVRMSAASLPPVTLRSLDAVHLASALAVRKHLSGFVSYDQRLLDAATHHDLPAASPGS